LDFNSDGLIEPGIHALKFDEFYDVFVSQFTTSERRQEIFDSLVDFLKSLTAAYKIQEVWLDGSYVTEKINPNDIDLVVFFEVEDYIKIKSDWNRIRAHVNIDPYCEVALNDHTKKHLNEQTYYYFVNQRNYWRGQFGFDRVDNPKGIIKITIQDIEKYFQGGESHVVGGN